MLAQREAMGARVAGHDARLVEPVGMTESSAAEATKVRRQRTNAIQGMARRSGQVYTAFDDRLGRSLVERLVDPRNA